MCQIIPFPQKNIQPYRMSPTIIYSLDEYGNNPPIEYERFTIWNSIYLNDRQRQISILFPAYMLGSCKKFFSEAKRLFEKRHDPEIVDPGKHIYDALFEIVHGITEIKKYSIANNSTGVFSSLSNQVNVDVLTTLYVSDTGLLKIGFKRTFYRWIPVEAKPAKAPIGLA